MGQIVAHPPLSKKEIKIRIKNGARTVEEIDPELAKFSRSGFVGILNRKKINTVLKKNITK